MAPAQLDQDARKKIRLLEKTLAKQGSGGEDLKKALELCAALHAAIAVQVFQQDAPDLEPWLQAFLDSNIPRKLVELALSSLDTAFPVPTAGPAPLVVPANKHVLYAWMAGQSLLFRFGFHLAAKPPLPKNLGKAVLAQLLPDDGEASKFLLAPNRHGVASVSNRGLVWYESVPDTLSASDTCCFMYAAACFLLHGVGGFTGPGLL